MKKVLIIALLLSSLLTLVWLLGPRPVVEQTLGDASALENTPVSNLEAWLRDREASHAGLVPGTEKRIVWAAEAGSRQSLALVYIHGYSASRQETAPLANNLARALGANLFETRLTGHGLDGEALANARINDWLNDAYEALLVAEKLGEQVVVIGTSTGGTLGWWLAAQFPDRVDKLVLISPNFKVKATGAEILGGPWGEQLAGLLIGKERSFTPRNALQAKYWTERYPSRALPTMLALVSMVRDVPVERLSMPVLTVMSLDDQVVDARFTQQHLQGLANPRSAVHYLEGSDDDNQHVLAGDILSPNTTEVVAEVIRSFIAQPQ